MTKIINKYSFFSRYGIDVHNRLFARRSKFMRLRGVRHAVVTFRSLNFRRSWDNMLLLDSSRGGKFKRRSRKTQYGLALSFQRKLRVFYGFRREAQLKKFVRISLYSKDGIGPRARLVRFMECRLDVLLWRIGFGGSFRLVRQAIGHKKVFVNGKVVNSPSRLLKFGDVVSLDPFFFHGDKFDFLRSVRSTLIRRNFSFLGKRALTNLNFVDIDYKNFAVVVNGAPRFTELSYPFGGTVDKLLWFYSLKYSS